MILSYLFLRFLSLRSFLLRKDHFSSLFLEKNESLGSRQSRRPKKGAQEVTRSATVIFFFLAWGTRFPKKSVLAWPGGRTWPRDPQNHVFGKHVSQKWNMLVSLRNTTCGGSKTTFSLSFPLSRGYCLSIRTSRSARNQ